jgi:hypothetical protein
VDQALEFFRKCDSQCTKGPQKPYQELKNALEKGTDAQLMQQIESNRKMLKNKIYSSMFAKMCIPHLKKKGDEL